MSEMLFHSSRRFIKLFFIHIRVTLLQCVICNIREENEENIDSNSDSIRNILSFRYYSQNLNYKLSCLRFLLLDFDVNFGFQGDDCEDGYRLSKAWLQLFSPKPLLSLTVNYPSSSPSGLLSLNNLSCGPEKGRILSILRSLWSRIASCSIHTDAENNFPIQTVAKTSSVTCCRSHMFVLIIYQPDIPLHQSAPSNPVSLLPKLPSLYILVLNMAARMFCETLDNFNIRRSSSARNEVVQITKNC
jgi:hypothetical protein